MARPESIPLSAAPLLEEAAPLTEAFGAAGHRLYLVGGIVRDLLVGRADKAGRDLDFTTDATPPQIKEIVGPLVDALWAQGERFGTIGAKIGERVYEITTHRSETYRDDSRKPEVRFSTAIDEDLSRRDFTVNALAIDTADGTLVDPHGGADDLASNRLRTPLDPAISFGDDPLRMLRAARFVSGYQLEPVPELVAAMTTMVDRLAIVSVERIRDELDKLLAVADLGVGLDLLVSTGLFAHVLPWAGEVDLAAVERAGADPTLRWAALVADRDPRIVEERLEVLRSSSARMAELITIVRGADAITDGAVASAPEFRRWWLLVGAHCEHARHLALAMCPGAAEAVEATRRLESELADELDDLGPPLRAHQVMAELGLVPGPEVGAALDHLLALRLDAGPMSEPAARAALRSWAAARELHC